MPEWTMLEIRAVVRTERLSRVLHALEEAGVSRATVNHVHGVGAGVDPAAAELSFSEEGRKYMDKVLLRILCETARREELVGVIAEAARTGKMGDGILSVHPVLDIMKIRTEARGPEALE